MSPPRQRHGDPRNEGRPESPKEERHDHDNQRDGQKEGELDIVHGSANGLRAIAQDGDLRLVAATSNLWEQGANFIHHGDDIGVGLLHHGQQDRPFIVKPSSLAGIPYRQ